MPGKHVRFASTSRVYAPRPIIAPISRSTVSSSAGVRTPNHPHHHLPPSSAHKPTRTLLLHPVLTFSRTPTINFDVSLPPSSITSHNHATLSSRVLSESATNPPLPFLTIMSPYLPWTIPVRPASPKPGAFVTVADVLNVLYCALRVNITEAEYNKLPSANDQHRAKSTYEKRWRRFRDPKASEERRGGMKRVDFLMGRNQFLGMSSSSRGFDVMHFNVT